CVSHTKSWVMPLGKSRAKFHSCGSLTRGKNEMRDTRREIRDTGYGIRDTRYGMRDMGYGRLVLSRISDRASRVPWTRDTRYGMQTASSYLASHISDRAFRIAHLASRIAHPASRVPLITSVISPFAGCFS